MTCTGAFGAFVYETPTEFISSGDFNGDGRLDALVLDKATGNARVGYQNASGALAWQSPVPTGVPQVGALAVGRFAQTNRDAIAVTSPEWNRIHILDLSSSSNVPVVVNPAHVGTSLLVGLEAPYGTTADRSWLVAGASAEYDPGVTLLDLFAFVGDSLAQFQDQIAAEADLTSGNSLRLGATATTSVGGIVRGSNDTFAAYSYGNATNVLYRVNLHAGTEYAFGRFRWGQDTQPTPGLLFYVPGQSNIIVQRVTENASGFTLSAPTITTFTSAVQRVYYVDEGSNGFGIVQFGDGAVGVRPASGSDQLQITPGLGLGPLGNVITGFVPLGPGQFALLSGASNSFLSVQSQVFTKSGSNYVQTSTSTLSAISTSGTRANVWLFASEPFVNAQPGFVASLNGGDWITSVSGLPGTVSVVAETDRGVTNGLGNPSSQNLGAAPNNAPYGIANQYHPAISLFSYSSPRAAQLIQVTISPPAGRYTDPIDVSFTIGDPTDHVYYRVGSVGAFAQYGAPFTLGTNAQVQFYAERFGFPERTPLETATYTITGGSISPLLTATNGPGTNAIPPGINPSNNIPSYAYGTVIYGRRNGSVGTIWAINLDGTTDRYITTGVRPRLSPDGRYLAFLREGNPFAGRGNLWVRDLLAGDETRLFVNPDFLNGYDWEYGTTNLIVDYFCNLWRIALDGTMTALPIFTDCYDDAPVQNPIDGRLAFHNLNGNTSLSGLFLASPGAAAKQRVAVNLPGASWPGWSPDGELLAVVNGNNSFTLDFGKDLWVVDSARTELHQITGFTGVDGFPHGAVWTPNGDALVGAATVFNTNGIWIVPLTSDRHACGSTPIRLRTTPGDAIDFVGNVFVPPPPPRLLIRRELDEVIVWWRRTAWPYVLQSAGEPTPAASWLDVPPPYAITNLLFEYRVPGVSAQPNQFFRLRLP